MKACTTHKMCNKTHNKFNLIAVAWSICLILAIKVIIILVGHHSVWAYFWVVVYERVLTALHHSATETSFSIILYADFETIINNIILNIINYFSIIFRVEYNNSAL